MYDQLMGRIRDRTIELLEEWGWARGYQAYTHEGDPVGCLDERAACFCLTGAIVRAVRELPPAWRERPFTEDGVRSQFYDTWCRANQFSGTSRSYLISFNDGIGMTRDRVVGSLHKIVTPVERSA